MIVFLLLMIVFLLWLMLVLISDNRSIQQKNKDKVDCHDLFELIRNRNKNKDI
jgi:hypothetical protein